MLDVCMMSCKVDYTRKCEAADVSLSCDRCNRSVKHQRAQPTGHKLCKHSAPSAIPATARCTQCPF